MPNPITIMMWRDQWKCKADSRFGKWRLHQAIYELPGQTCKMWAEL